MVHLSDMKKPISCTVIGDGMVGKTCLSEVFSGQTMPQEYVSTVFNNYAGKSTVGGDKYVVSIFDSAGEHEYTELRSFSYKDSEVLLLCFSVSDRDSFESVKDFWAPEVKDFLGKRVPIIVVATQTDTRSDLGGDVSTEEGQRMAKEIGAERYLECSCSDQQSVHSVFEHGLSGLPFRKRTRLKMTAALTFLCVVSVWSGVLSDVHVGGIGLPQTVGIELGVADTRLKYVQSTVTGSCRCGGSSCQCCKTIRVLTEKEDVCIKVQYLKKNSGVLLTVTWGGKVVYSKEVSVRNPPAICLKVPFLKKVGKLCVQLYNMDVGKSGLSGCTRISLKVAFIKVVKVELGCFKIPFAEDEIMELTASSKMEVLLRNRERDLEMKLFANYLKHLFREDQ